MCFGDLIARVGIAIKGLADSSEVAVETIENLVERGVFVAGGELAGEGEEEIDLKEDLRSINAIKEAIEFGGIKGVIEGSIGGSFGSGERFGESERIFFFAISSLEVRFELGASASKSASKGRGDGAELRGLEAAIVSRDGLINILDASVELFRQIGRGSITIVNKSANADENGEGDKPADENLEDEAIIGEEGSETGRLRGGAGRLGDLIEILELVHRIIITCLCGFAI